MPLVIEQDRRAQQGAWLFLASLGIFFISSMILFVIYISLRLERLGPEVTAYYLPPSFVVSTLLLIGVSLSLHYSLVSAKADQSRATLWLAILASALAMLFFSVQSHGMYWLVHSSLGTSVPGLSPYGFTFILALLHALHVVGGIVALVRVVAQAIRRQYDHERHWGLKFCALYWHFLDIVWIVMLVGFGIAAYLIRDTAQREAIQSPAKIVASEPA